VNKDELLKFYENRWDFLESLDNGTIDFSSINKTNIQDSYILEKKDHPILIVGNFPKFQDMEVLPSSALTLLKNNLESNNISFQKDVILTNSFPFALTEKALGNKLINRAPTQIEALAGSIMLLREIELIQPKMIIALGNSALIALKYSKCEKFVKSLDDLSLNFLLDTYLDFLEQHIIIGYTHYPSSLNMKNDIKLNEFQRFCQNIKIIREKGYREYVNSLTKKDFATFSFGDFTNSIMTQIEKDYKLATPKVYQEYFFKMLRYQDPDRQEEIKNILLSEK
jgi:uracil-DNA glycosylase